MPRALKVFFCGLNSVYMFTLWKNYNFNKKSIGIFAGILLFENLALTVPNLINERV